MFDVPRLETYKTMTYEGGRWFADGEFNVEQSSRKIHGLWMSQNHAPIHAPVLYHVLKMVMRLMKPYTLIYHKVNAYCTSNANTSQNTNVQLISWPSSYYISTYDDHFSPIWKRTTHETRGPDRSGPWWKWPFLRGDDKLLGFMAKLRWSCWAKNSVVWRRLWRLFPGGP